VIGVNNLGGCFGSTGPMTIETRRPASPAAADFPLVAVDDWVDAPGAAGRPPRASSSSAAVVGGSLGGMQALRLGASPTRSACATRVVIAAAPNLSAQNIAFNEVARQAILTDPDFHGGHFYGHGVVPDARAAAWRACSGTSPTCPTTRWPSKFGRRLRERRPAATASTSSSQIECYLRHQGDKFAGYFDANTYLRHHQGARLLRPGAARPAATWRRALAPRRAARFLVISLHHRLALRAGALARDRQGAGRRTASPSTTRRSTRRTGTMPSCSTTPRYHGGGAGPGSSASALEAARPPGRASTPPRHGRRRLGDDHDGGSSKAGRRRRSPRTTAMVATAEVASDRSRSRR
jgi:hypothetical protein